jgi:putative oxidoreductase
MATTLAVALLLLRLVAGLTLAAHGAQKLLGWFEGPGMAKWTKGLQSQGFRPAPLWAGFTVLGELGGGLSLAFGFLTPLGAAGAFGGMLMAIMKAHWKNGFFNSKRGIEFPLALLTIATAIGISTPGPYSLDSAFGIVLPYPQLFLILALAAVIVDIVGLMMTRQQATVSATPSAQSQQPS